jgi:predicted transcriptional regulator
VRGKDIQISDNSKRAKTLKFSGRIVTQEITDRDLVRHGRGEVDIYATINLSTGEEIARYVVDGRNYPDPGDWLRIWQGLAVMIADDERGFSPIESRVLWWVLAKAGFGNQVEVKVTELAKRWGTSRESVSRALSSLVERRIVERSKSRNGCRINPNFAWKGEDDLRRSFVQRWARDEATAAQQAQAKQETSA